MRAHNFSRSIGRLAFSLGLLGVLAWPISGSAQAPASQPSLAEVARKEAERRKSAKDAKKVITSKDMPESARKPASAPAASEAGAPAGGSHAGGAHSAGAAARGPSDQQSTAPGAASSSSQNDESAWRARMSQAREGLRRNETFHAEFNDRSRPRAAE